MRKLASIRKVSELLPIEGADNIEVAQIDGWKVVVKKGEFQVNDLCIYFEIDSILPEKEEFEFLRHVNFRIKTIKLRKQVSQGICFPLSILENVLTENYSLYGNTIVEIAFVQDCEGRPPSFEEINHKIEEELDLTDMIGVIKYEPKVHSSLRNGQARGNFPSYVPKTDEERIQNLTKNWNNLSSMEYTVSEKLDGSSFTAILNDGEFHVCSRNLDLKQTEGNLFWEMAIKYELESKLKQIDRNVALQGELIGPNVQGNKYQLKENEVRFFYAFDIDSQEYLSNEDFLFLIEEVLDLKTVPILLYNFSVETWSINDVLNLAESKSMLNNNTEREGIVFVSKDKNKYGHKISFKAISNKFLLKSGE